MEINSLIFDDIEVENDFRWLLKQRLKEDDLYSLYNNEINFLPMDTDYKQKVDLPAVTITVFQSESINPDDVQLQAHTPFTVEIEVYTSGKKKVLNNKTICNAIIKIMQSNGQLPHYYCRGLMLEENREVGTLLDSAYRRVIRMSGLCDNNLKLIKRRKI